MEPEKNNQPFNPLQHSLFKVAQVGNINSMIDFIEAGADPYLPDEDGRNPIFYATCAAPDKIDMLMPLLKKLIVQRGRNYDD